MSITFTTAQEAVSSFTTGKVDKGSIISWAKAANLVKNDVLLLLQKGAIDVETASAKLAELETPKQAQKLYCKVSEKGAISVYGLQRMPVTLYVEQWERLHKEGGVLEFCEANKAHPAVVAARESKAAKKAEAKKA